MKTYKKPYSVLVVLEDNLLAGSLNAGDSLGDTSFGGSTSTGDGTPVTDADAKGFFDYWDEEMF